MAVKSRDTENTPSFHPRNRHHGLYAMEELCKSYPGLTAYTIASKSGRLTIDFFDPAAVKALNKALLKNYYQLAWDIPQGFLCSPIPGRADYTHYMADLLSEDVPADASVRIIDIGMGANCIYPIIGIHEYGWEFVGSDIDQRAIDNATVVIQRNTSLQGKLICRKQEHDEHFFRSIIQEGEKFALSICNPPFYASAKEAQKANQQKMHGLIGKQPVNKPLNFGGQSHELWFPGGEERFVRMMIHESKHYRQQCLWFSSLIAKREHLRPLKKVLKKVGAAEVRTIKMEQGNKQSRVLAWTFHDTAARKNWF